MRTTGRCMAKYDCIWVTCHSTAVYSLSQVVVNCTERMRHIETKFIGHPNDAQQFNLISRIGLDLPVLLADKIYSNRFPLMTLSAYIWQWDNKRQCRRINRAILKYRIVTKDTFLTANVCLVAKIVVRRKHLGLIELNKVRYSVTQICEKTQICLFVGHTGFIA